MSVPFDLNSLKAANSRVDAVVLLSSGLDSSVNLAWALSQNLSVLALTFDYGQRAALKEVSRSQQLAAFFKVPHYTVSLPWLQDITATALVNRELPVPQGGELSLDDSIVSLKSAGQVWVPNRNGVFLNIAAAFAESLKATYVIAGFNIEEAATFPDNSKEFLDSLDRSFVHSTATQVKTLCYTVVMDKAAIYKKGNELGVPFELLWPCYLEGETLCGKCESCQRFFRAKRLCVDAE